LALLVGNATLPGSRPAPSPAGAGTEIKAVACGEGIEDYKACHSDYPTGCNTNGSYDAYLNLFKNQVKWSNTQPQKWFTRLSQLQDLESKIPPGLSKTNHDDHVQELEELGEGSISGMLGYLYDVKTEGKESSNCQVEGGDNFENVDFHLYIGFDAGLAERLKNKTAGPQDKQQVDVTSVIVEMTPHYRGRFRPEWTKTAVRQAIGSRVRVEGQLMVDNEHYVASQDCGHADHTGDCWRATVWELHPVTDFQVCNTGTCPDQSSAGWSPLAEKAAVESAAKSGGKDSKGEP
jgi:hypothetical protein